jgi:glycosyltransferase involved in cell wall biosynthesis
VAVPAPKISVVVPVYNPGGAFDECIDSLLGQSMPARDLELILVDDGSTDGTGERLDALAAEHPHVRVEHIPNSGWPGRPRNVGLDMARGEYVHFVDNDDWLDPEALERVHATAVLDRADVVVGKVVGHGGKRVPRELFERNLHGVKFRSTPVLLRMLTPHKLFRRALLEEHGLRFPEGVRRLEDHPFVVDAYFRAKRISVVADHPIYHWVTRDPRDSASRRRVDPWAYFDNVREVLDLVEARTDPGPFRDRALMHWYRRKLMQRVGGSAFLRRDPDHQHEFVEAVRALALERYPEAMDAALPYSLRLRSELLRAGDHDGLRVLAGFEAQLRARARATRVKGNGKHLFVRVRGRLGGRETPFAVRREGDRLLWTPPEPLLSVLGPERLDVTDELATAHVQVHLKRPEDGSEHVVPGRTEMVLEPGPEPGELRPVLVATAWIAPTTAAGGAPLRTGQWEVYATLDVAGFSRGRRIKWRGEPLTVTAVSPGRILAGARVPPRMTLRRRVVRRLPRRLRRALAAAGGAVRG